MVERHGDVNEGLKEEPVGGVRVEPDAFQDLVGVKVLAAVEELDAVAEEVVHDSIVIRAMADDGVMPEWLDRLVGRGAEAGELRGVPANPRLKNYAAVSGYAYEYVFEGFRDAPAGREYVFCVSGDRKNWFHFTVVVEGEAVEKWQRDHDRRLADNERYGLAKLALFAALDERENPAAVQAAPWRVRAAEAAHLLEQLGIE
jgi:hypothetical protein